MIQNFPAYYYTMLVVKNGFRNTIIIFLVKILLPLTLINLPKNLDLLLGNAFFRQVRQLVNGQKIEGQRFLDFLEIVHRETYIQKQTLHIVCSVVGNDWYQKQLAVFQLWL